MTNETLKNMELVKSFYSEVVEVMEYTNATLENEPLEISEYHLIMLADAVERKHDKLVKNDEFIKEVNYMFSSECDNIQLCLLRTKYRVQLNKLLFGSDIDPNNKKGLTTHELYLKYTLSC